MAHAVTVIPPALNRMCQRFKDKESLLEKKKYVYAVCIYILNKR